jgi:hypothetical protein
MVPLTSKLLLWDAHGRKCFDAFRISTVDKCHRPIENGISHDLSHACAFCVALSLVQVPTVVRGGIQFRTRWIQLVAWAARCASFDLTSHCLTIPEVAKSKQQ